MEWFNIFPFLVKKDESEDYVFWCATMEHNLWLICLPFIWNNKLSSFYKQPSFKLGHLKHKKRDMDQYRSHVVDFFIT